MRTGVYIQMVNDGYQVYLTGMENLTLSGDWWKTTFIVAEPRYADVLAFTSSDRVTIRDLTLGHTPEKGSCQGAVLSFEGCGSIALEDLDLYGCGTYGVEANKVDRLTMKDSVIRDCSYGLMTLRNVASARFENDTFRDTEQFDMLEIIGSGAEFTGCEFMNNTWDDWFGFMNAEGSSVLFTECVFYDGADYDDIVARSAEKGWDVVIRDSTVRRFGENAGMYPVGTQD